jgi:SAM-dependent methyltransferase
LYRQSSKQSVSFIKELGGLRPDERILDLGCGCGRVAAGLIHYLDHRGSYEGLDIAPNLIRWCAEEIEPHHRNFRFQRADIRHEIYNPAGSSKASEFQFPYPDDSFDVVYAGSLFTHLLPSDSENYLKQISRVLKKNGRCLISYFLLNDESTRLNQEGLSPMNFAFPIGEARAIDERAPEAAVAYPEEFILGLYKENSLRVTGPVRYGSWCGRPRPFKGSNQDMMVAVKD